MAKIIPFKAVRPTRENASLVTSRSYDDYSPAELAAQLDFNPLSFLHVLSPAYQDPQKHSMERRFKLVHQKYQEFKDEKILVQDQKPAYYIHRMISKNTTFTGIIVATSISDYKSDVIKKHEDTLQYRVETFKNYIKYAGFNTEPVLLTYPDNAELSSWIFDQTQRQADIEFITTSMHSHNLWKIDDEKQVAFLTNTFDAMPHLYIADGHHRSASAEMLYDEDHNSANHVKEYFMSFLIASSNVKVYEYNRLIKDLNGLSNDEFLTKIEKYFDILPSGDHPIEAEERHKFGMYLQNRHYVLSLKTELCNFETPLEGLDAQLLYSKILAPILNITDLRNDERIEYHSGKEGLLDLKRKVDEGEFELAFILYPSNIDEIKAIADANQIMPPKSTYIDPKFRSGLAVYEL